MSKKPRKFKLVDNNSPIFSELEIGSRGIEVNNFPLIKIWNTKKEIQEFQFVAVQFEEGSVQIVSEIQLEELPEDTELTFGDYDKDYYIPSDYTN